MKNEDVPIKNRKGYQEGSKKDIIFFPAHLFYFSVELIKMAWSAETIVIGDTDKGRNFERPLSQI